MTPRWRVSHRDARWRRSPRSLASTRGISIATTSTCTDDAEPVDGDAVDTAACTEQATAAAPLPADEAWFGWDDHGRFRLSVNVGADTGGVDRSGAHRGARRPVPSGEHLRRHGRRRSSRSPNAPSMPSPQLIAGIATGSTCTSSGADASTDCTRPHRFRQPVAERITCDALVAPIWCDDGLPVSVGRSQHIVPDRTRRIVEHRDGGCRVPGCRHDRFVEVHHIIHWSAHGPTDTWNLICLCPRHHRLHHQGRLGITGNADVEPTASSSPTPAAAPWSNREPDPSPPGHLHPRSGEPGSTLSANASTPAGSSSTTIPTAPDRIPHNAELPADRRAERRHGVEAPRSTRLSSIRTPRYMSRSKHVRP